MYIKINENNYIVMMSVEAFPNAIVASEPSQDVITWFATGKYKFINGEYVIQNDWVEPHVSLTTIAEVMQWDADAKRFLKMYQG